MEAPLRNLPLLGALVLAGFEVLLLVGAAIWSLVSIASDTSGVAVSVALSVVLLMFAFLLVAGINGLWHGRRWGRGPVLTWQLIQAAIALGAFGIAPPWAFYPTLAVSILIGIGLLLPASVAATSRSAGSAGTVL